MPTTVDVAVANRVDDPREQEPRHEQEQGGQGDSHRHPLAEADALHVQRVEGVVVLEDHFHQHKEKDEDDEDPEGLLAGHILHDLPRRFRFVRIGRFSLLRLGPAALGLVDAELAERFAPVATALREAEDAIVAELNGAQGDPVDIGGYFQPDEDLTSKAMRKRVSLGRGRIVLLGV